MNVIWEYIAVIYNECEERTERKYGLVAGDETTALAKIGSWYGDSLLRLEYFGTPAEDADDCLYELNNSYADKFNITGRKFGKTIPPVNEIPLNDIYE
jgi:hypothetical protein